MIERTCTQCGKSKPLYEFTPSKRHLSGWKPQCKECLNEAKRIRVKNLKEKQACIAPEVADKSDLVPSRDHSNYKQDYVPPKDNHREVDHKSIPSRGLRC